MNERLVPVRLPYEVNFVAEEAPDPRLCEFLGRCCRHDPRGRSGGRAGRLSGIRPGPLVCGLSTGRRILRSARSEICCGGRWSIANGLMAVSKFVELAASGNHQRPPGICALYAPAAICSPIPRRTFSNGLKRAKHRARLMRASSQSALKAARTVHPLKDDDSNCHTPSVSLLDRSRSASRGLPFESERSTNS